MNDGGQAFPVGGHDGPGDHNDGHKGMSIRDYFAGQALAGLLAECGSVNTNQMQRGVMSCYKFADAMIAARRK